jgi:hypothetical protein
MLLKLHRLAKELSAMLIIPKNDVFLLFQLGNAFFLHLFTRLPCQMSKLRLKADTMGEKCLILSRGIRRIPRRFWWMAPRS